MSINARSLILAGLAIVVAGVAALLAYNWVQSNQPTAPQTAEQPVQRDTETEILVAKLNLPAGTILNSDHLRWQSWPERAVADSYVMRGRRTMEDFLGAVVKKGIPIDIPLTDQSVVKPGERGFLAAVLTPGMRAISVPVNQTSGIAGFVFPGDRVDLVLTQTIRREEEEHKASETILENVRVLAIDQRMDDQDGTPNVGRTATLEVTPRQVELISVARELGTLSLSLRSLASEDGQLPEDENLESVPPERGRTHTWDSSVSRLIPAVGREGDQIEVLVARGNSARIQRFEGSE